MPDNEQTALKWQRRYEREKNARAQAESLLEEKSSQLYIANQQLEQKVVLESSKFKREEEKFTALFHYSKDGIILHTEEGEIINANQTICDLLCTPKGNLIGAHISTIHPEASLPLYKQAFQDIAIYGNTRFECHIINTNLQQIPVEIAATRFQVGGKSIIQGIIRDITLNRESAKELEIATKTAIKANEAKSLFLATMSHEIRTPLNGIIGFTDLLLHSEVSTEQYQHLTLIKKSGDLLLSVINDILDFSRIESSQIELEEMDFNLIENIEDVLDIHSQSAALKQVDLLYSIDPNIPDYLHGDPGRLKQILLNLVSNGLKFTEHGAVSIKVTKSPPQNVQFSISDTGIGFDDIVKNQIFKPFQQADASTTRKYGGTGLGLAICKQLIEVMEGSISAISTIGVGSKFTITLPFKEAKSVHPPKQPVPSSLVGLNTFILDDNSINLEFMQARLEKWGCKVTTCTSPHEALTLLAPNQSQENFDLLFIDMLMPKMDGFQFAQKLQLLHPTTSCPRMLLITSSREVQQSQAHQAGFSALIYKPIKEQLLLSAIHTSFQKCNSELTPHLARPHKNQPTTLNKFALIVEDNHINAKLAKLLIERLGIIVHIAHNGKEALESLSAKQQYNIIFMDMQMPVMDGLTATENIRNKNAYSHYKNTPIIAMTANVLPEDEERCRIAGMNDYLTKPIDLQKIKLCLKKYEII